MYTMRERDDEKMTNIFIAIRFLYNDDYYILLFEILVILSRLLH